LTEELPYFFTVYGLLHCSVFKVLFLSVFATTETSISPRFYHVNTFFKYFLVFLFLYLYYQQ